MTSKSDAPTTDNQTPSQKPAAVPVGTSEHGSVLDVADCCVTLEEAQDVIRRREEYLRGVIAWMDERRNSPAATTLGQIQEKLRPLLGLATAWKTIARRAFHDADLEPDTMGKKIIEMKAMCYANNASEAEEVLKKIETILAGIDAAESDSDAGWWETSEGAKMGAKKLAQIRALLA